MSGEAKSGNKSAQSSCTRGYPSGRLDKLSFLLPVAHLPFETLHGFFHRSVIFTPPLGARFRMGVRSAAVLIDILTGREFVDRNGLHGVSPSLLLQFAKRADDFRPLGSPVELEKNGVLDHALLFQYTPNRWISKKDSRKIDGANV